jgi:uncharacterized protein
MSDPFFLYPLLFLTGSTAGFVDSIAGGGGLITLPVLLNVGLPPQLALGTNKFQSSFGSFTAALYYVRRGLASLNDARVGIACTLIGALSGAYAVQRMSGKILEDVIPIMLLAVLVYMIAVPRAGMRENKNRIMATSGTRAIGFYVIAGLVLGFYDGFFGPGVGSFWAITFVTGLGFDLKKATAYTKVMNFSSNSVSLIVFLCGGYVLFTLGITMAIGQILGAKLGSRLVIFKGVRIIRPFYIIIVLLTIVKLLYSRLLQF